nr:MAG TPA: hypothetical protein [Caudoviricetes sp.]
MAFEQKTILQIYNSLQIKYFVDIIIYIMIIL